MRTVMTEALGLLNAAGAAVTGTGVMPRPRVRSGP
jgi:hypothetical protein